jgi:hypothetical protein
MLKTDGFGGLAREGSASCVTGEYISIDRKQYKSPVKRSVIFSLSSHILSKNLNAQNYNFI